MSQIPTKIIKHNVLTIAVTGDKAYVPKDQESTTLALEGLITFFKDEMDRIYIQTPYGSIPFKLLNPVFSLEPKKKKEER